MGQFSLLATSEKVEIVWEIQRQSWDNPRDEGENSAELITTVENHAQIDMSKSAQAELGGYTSTLSAHRLRNS